MQDEHNTIIEWAHNSVCLVRYTVLSILVPYILTLRVPAGDFMKVVLPNADIIALVRNIGPGGEPAQVPNMFWVGQDQVLSN